ncbi:diguanylate cyclase [Glaciecola siphonariae]|uniref:diguanylate cyclase n=1 Tax=Glaciecola siphonariae TaxID=521012 RepID=A0ABV9LVY2_9ALTE
MNLIQIVNKHVNRHKNDALVCALLSVCAILINTYTSISIYGSISIYVGSIFALIALLTLPLRFSLIVLICSLSSFALQLGSMSFVVIQAMEFAVVWVLSRFLFNFLLAVFLFWLILGFPSVFGILHSLAGMSFDTALFTAITIGLNGFVCGIIAMLIYWLLPIDSPFKRFNPPPPKFANVVFELCIVSVILPTILVTLVFTWRSTDETETLISNQLASSNVQLENALTNRMSHSLESVSAAAQGIAAQNDSQLASLMLHAIATANRDIEAMLVTDSNAVVTMVAPEKYSKDFVYSPDFNLSTRAYFYDTQKNRQPQVSQVLETLDSADIEIVAVTAPIVKNNTFEGIVQASIFADQLIDANVNLSIENSGIQIIITDVSDAIIYATHELQINGDKRFEVERTGHPFLRYSPVMKVNNEPFIYHASSNEFGWNIYTVAPPNMVFASIVNYFLFIGLTLLGSLILIALLANRLSNKITAPLVNLEKYIADKIGPDSLGPQAQISREMANVTSNFVKAHELSLTFQAQLKQQVSVKTKELKKLNKQLELSSQQDALTGIYNRGAFDQLAMNSFKTCVRNQLPFTMVLLDIDYFKKVNDTYGHIAGDKCIISVAQSLKERCKRGTDIVARYGGEEYIVLMTGSDFDSHLKFIESIHAAIAEKPIDIGEKTVNLTVSIGVVSVSKDFTLSFDKIVQLADEQLYKSKGAGRNTVSAIDI